MRSNGTITTVPAHITEAWLLDHPEVIFVFGDNEQRKGLGGAAKLRNVPNTYGFITKKAPNNDHTSFYEIEEYQTVYIREIERLKEHIRQHPNSIYVISAVGSGLANLHGIWEAIIRVNICLDLDEFRNRIVYLFLQGPTHLSYF